MATMLNPMSQKGVVPQMQLLQQWWQQTQIQWPRKSILIGGTDVKSNDPENRFNHISNVVIVAGKDVKFSDPENWLRLRSTILIPAGNGVKSNGTKNRFLLKRKVVVPNGSAAPRMSLKKPKKNCRHRVATVLWRLVSTTTSPALLRCNGFTALLRFHRLATVCASHVKTTTKNSLHWLATVPNSYRVAAEQCQKSAGESVGRETKMWEKWRKKSRREKSALRETFRPKTPRQDPSFYSSTHNQQQQQQREHAVSL